jgi:tRNA (guanine-N7-)-methyltransferase
VVESLTQRFDWSAIFRNDRPVEIDLGAGDGGFAVVYAARHQERNLVAVERLLGRVRKIEKRAARGALANLRVLRLELGYTVRHLLPPESLAVAHILFPDPWPKRRHWPRRLLQPEFVRDLARALTPSGELRFTTDHEDYFHSARAAVEKAACLQVGPGWDWANDPKTDFQKTFEAEGRSIWRGHWIKDPP